MEEDIKILEKFCKNPIGVNYSETKQAIENILDRLEQLEKENEELNLKLIEKAQEKYVEQNSVKPQDNFF